MPASPIFGQKMIDKPGFFPYPLQYFPVSVAVFSRIRCSKTGIFPVSVAVF